MFASELTSFTTAAFAIERRPRPGPSRHELRLAQILEVLSLLLRGELDVLRPLVGACRGNGKPGSDVLERKPFSVKLAGTAMFEDLGHRRGNVCS